MSNIPITQHNYKTNDAAHRIIIIRTALLVVVVEWCRVCFSDKYKCTFCVDTASAVIASDMLRVFAVNSTYESCMMQPNANCTIHITVCTYHYIIYAL